MDEGKSGSGLLVGTGLGGLGGGEVERLGLGDQIVEIGGLQRAGLLEDDLALLGDHQRGHRLDAGGLGQILVGVDIHLDEGDVRVLRLVGGRLENRAERAARAAPGGPEVNEHDFVVGDGLLEIGRGDGGGCHDVPFFCVFLGIAVRPSCVAAGRLPYSCNTSWRLGPCGSWPSAPCWLPASQHHPTFVSYFPPPAKRFPRFRRKVTRGVILRAIMGCMPVMNDEVPDEGDYDAGRGRGEFDNITPEDFIHGGGSGHGNPPGWLGPSDINRARHQMPIAYVEIVPVRTDEMGRISQVGSLLRVSEDGSIERTLITGRVLYHETLREAIARNVAKDLGDIALPLLPIGLQPFTVAEFFPTPGLSEYYDPRQHAIALCYVVPIAGDCKPQDETLDVEWVDPKSDVMDTFVAQMVNGHGRIVRQALAWAGI